MGIVVALLGIVILFVVLIDTFETIVVPKTVNRSFRITSIFYRSLWKAWSWMIRHLKEGPFRLTLLGAYGPISLLLLIASWAIMLFFSFGMIHWGFGTLDRPGYSAGFGTTLYFSGVTFFTLGYGDLTPVHGPGQTLAVFEAGIGFGFLAVVISYVPVLYQAFSQRETSITLLDSKAGSNPSAGELLRRHAEAECMEDLIVLLKEWEVWAARQLEAYLSYPILAYYRSQHDDQSWLCSLTAILDTCAVISLGFEGNPSWEKRLQFQAKATFAMGRHVVVDLAYLLATEPDPNPPARYSPEDWRRLQSDLRVAGAPINKAMEAALAEQRGLYEGYVVALAKDLFFVLPAWLKDPNRRDNWEETAWDDDEHFTHASTVV